MMKYSPLSYTDLDENFRYTYAVRPVIRRTAIKVALVVVFFIIVISSTTQNIPEEHIKVAESDLKQIMSKFQTQKTTLGLDHICVLILGTERQGYFQPVLDQVNFDYEIFRADQSSKRIPELTTNIREWQALETTDKKKVLEMKEKDMPGIVGCTLGHRAMWQDMMDNDYETVMLSEDDADIDINIETILAELMQEIPDDWDALYPGYCGHRWMDTKNGTSPEDGQRWHRMYRAICGHSYKLRRNTTRTLMESDLFTSPEHMQRPWDMHMADMMPKHKLVNNVYGFDPQLVRQRPKSAKHPSLVELANSTGVKEVRDEVYMDWRFKTMFDKEDSAAYRAGVFYWHDQYHCDFDLAELRCTFTSTGYKGKFFEIAVYIYLITIIDV